MPVFRAITLVVILAVALVLSLLARLFGSPRFHDRVALLTCRALLWTIRVRIVTDGFVPNEARLLVANHVSWIDVLALGSVEQFCFLAKREVGTWPVIGLLARQQGTVFVDRARRRTILSANRTMSERLAAGRSVLIFPEGTTFDGARRGPFYTSHLACLRDGFRAADPPPTASAQAIALSYSDPRAAWIGDATLVPHLWDVLVGEPITCTLQYGRIEQVMPGYDRKALGRHLAACIETSLATVPRPAPASAGWPTWRSTARPPVSEASETARDPARATARSGG